MAKYKIWDKKSDIYTPGKDALTGKMVWSAEEYIENFAQWAIIPNAKIIVGGGLINGTVFMEFDSTVEFYKNQGVNINNDMSDDEVLKAIEEFENKPPEPFISAEERIAAALEFQNILSM